MWWSTSITAISLAERVDQLGELGQVGGRKSSRRLVERRTVRLADEAPGRALPASASRTATCRGSEPLSFRAANPVQSAVIARSRSRRSSRSDPGSASSALANLARRNRCAPTITFSSTVRRPNSPTPCRRPGDAEPRTSGPGESGSSGWPRQVSEPESGSTNPQMTLNRVVFPAPLGPMIPSTSPVSTSTETVSSAVIPPNETDTSRTVRLTPVCGSLSTRGHATAAWRGCQFCTRTAASSMNRTASVGRAQS